MLALRSRPTTALWIALSCCGLLSLSCGEDDAGLFKPLGSEENSAALQLSNAAVNGVPNSGNGSVVVVVTPPHMADSENGSNTTLVPRELPSHDDGNDPNNLNLGIMEAAFDFPHGGFQAFTIQQQPQRTGLRR